MNINVLSDNSINNKKAIICFDNHNLLYKSYYAVPKFHDNHGRPTGAIQGALSIVFKFLNKYPKAHYCVASDSKGGNFRHKLFEQYKAHRKEIDEELIKQIISMPDFYKSMGMPFFATQGFEADDLIGSLAQKIKRSEEYVLFIVSSDKDLMQLIDDEKVFLIDPTKDIIFNSDEVVKKFGVLPSQVHDYLSLIGDASDNIPGAKSVGPKTALKILKYGKLSDLIANPSIIDDKKLNKLVVENIESIILSQKLVALECNLDVDISNAHLDLTHNKHSMLNLLGEYSLHALQKTFEKLVKKFEGDEISIENNISNSSENSFHQKNADKKDYKITPSIRKKMEENGLIAVNFDANDKKFNVYFDEKIYNFDDEDLDDLIDLLKNPMIRKIVYNQRALIENLGRKIHSLSNIHDLSVIFYHLIGTKANNDILDILYYEQIQYQNATNYIIFYLKLYELGMKKLFQSQHLEYFDLDRKIYKILSKMENIGILVDRDGLANLGKYFDDLLTNIKENIIDETGYDFNILSPKQTSDILFNKLEISSKSVKKLKGEGGFSTSQEVLENLSNDGIVVADYILQYRSIYKLKSSYCDGLANEIEEDGRIHTKFELNGATTGRILSSSPNLQNIPTKSEEGKKIRSCFVAKDDYVLISADYSQIELRILAHIADVKNLKKAFDEEIDVHQLTASNIFGIPFEKVDSFWRSKAKAVNFGIIYGISPFGLSKQLKITTSEASDIIKNYLFHYGEINDYLEKTKNFASQNGYVRTIFGRNCYLQSQLNDGTIAMPKNFFEKQFFERAAINAPIQGSASDIIKYAMIKIDNLILESQFETRLLLQIHDELIFESPENEVENISNQIKKIMESIGDEIFLKLKVDVSQGKSWLDL